MIYIFNKFILKEFKDEKPTVKEFNIRLIKIFIFVQMIVMVFSVLTYFIFNFIASKQNWSSVSELPALVYGTSFMMGYIAFSIRPNKGIFRKNAIKTLSKKFQKFQ